MNILILSDLHFEFHKDGGKAFVANMADADVCLCPGDLADAASIWDSLLLMLTKYEHVVFCYGNHEFYKSSFSQVRQKVARLLERLPKMGEQYGQLHVLDNSTCEIEGRRFIGTTLWFRNREDNGIYAQSLNDFHLIAFDMLGDGGVATARKRTRRMADVVIEVFAALPDADVTEEEVRDAISPEQ